MNKNPDCGCVFADFRFKASSRIHSKPGAMLIGYLDGQESFVVPVPTSMKKDDTVVAQQVIIPSGRFTLTMMSSPVELIDKFRVSVEAKHIGK